MSHKVNPVGFRTGTFMPWKSRWFVSGSQYKENLVEDIRIRKELFDKLKLAGVTSVEIERLPKSIVIQIAVARPGVVIGRGGSGIEDVKRAILEVIRKNRKGASVRDIKMDLRVSEIKNPELSAYLVASRMVGDLERRMPHRRTVVKTMDRVMSAGAKGIKVVLAGRIGGAEISRIEKFHQGSVPTQTLREDIDYAQYTALLQRGYVGVKVWIHKGEEKQ